MDSKLIWYTARASGILSWSLLAASVVAGLTMSLKLARRRVRTAWIIDLHRFLAMGTLVFLGVHVGSIMLDSYTHFGLTAVLVPLAASWHPAAVAWGIVGFYLLVAIEVTSLLRAWLPLRVWRSTHFLTFPLYVLTTVHGLTAGTDRHSVVMKVTFYGTSILVALLAAARVVEARAGHDPLGLAGREVSPSRRNTPAPTAAAR